MNFLNLGLKTCCQYSNKVEDYIVDIQVATQNLDDTEKIVTKNKCGNILSSIDKTRTTNTPKRIVKSLNEKPVVYTKSDKGNQIVILEETEYIGRMENLLHREEYIQLNKNPLNSCIKSVNETLKNVNVIPNKEKFKVKSDNPTIPRIYGLPKTHKPGTSMRPIISNIDSPTYKLAKWLNEKFNSFKKFRSLSIKNSFDLTKKLEEIELNNDDVLVSFDVIGLFPSVPTDRIPTLLRKWLEEVGINPREIEEYVVLTNLCLDQNFFSFNQKFYKQKSGLAMGNPLSPFLADLYMSSIEVHVTEAFPAIFKMWHRYVDDIIAIVPRKLIGDSLKLLNLQDKALKFTMEVETQKQLPFLDLKIMRDDKKISFGIHRKPTQSDNYIKCNKFNPRSHQFAVFNSLIHRMVNLPLNKTEYQKDYSHILMLERKIC